MGNLPKLIKKKLNDVLLEEGLVRDQHLAEAMNRQKASNEPLGVVLQKMGVLSEFDLARALCKQLNLPYLDAGRYSVPKEVAEIVPVDEMKANHFVVMDRIGKTLLVGVSDASALEVLEGIEKRTGYSLFVVVTTPTQLDSAIGKTGGKAAAKPAAAPAAANPAAPAAPKPAAPAAKPGTSVLPRPGVPPAAKPASPVIKK